MTYGLNVISSQHQTLITHSQLNKDTMVETKYDLIIHFLYKLKSMNQTVKIQNNKVGIPIKNITWLNNLVNLF